MPGSLPGPGGLGGQERGLGGRLLPVSLTQSTCPCLRDHGGGELAEARGSGRLSLQDTGLALQNRSVCLQTQREWGAAGLGGERRPGRSLEPARWQRGLEPGLASGFLQGRMQAATAACEFQFRMPAGEPCVVWDLRGSSNHCHPREGAPGPG